MDFGPSEEQRLLTDSIRRLLAREHDFHARRQIVSSPSGSSAGLWRKLASIGLLSVPFAVEDGGFGGGAVDLFEPLAACGEALLVEPLLSTLAPAGRLVATLAGRAQRAELLPRIIDGSLRLAFAHEESPFDETAACLSTTAVRTASGWRLSGDKQMVMHAPLADRLVVSASLGSDDGARRRTGVFLVDPQASGVVCHSFRTIDDFRAGDIEFRDLAVPGDALLGAGHDPLDAQPAIAEAVDFATALVCAEAIGVMDFANRATLDHLKTRKQFGAPIGSFQALQHRFVEMTIQAAQARSISLLACARVDGAARGRIDAGERMRIVSAAKAMVAMACRHIGQEAIQLHGGIGMTVETKMAHAFKRLTVLATEHGDADFHFARYARVSDGAVPLDPASVESAAAG